MTRRIMFTTSADGYPKGEESVFDDELAGQYVAGGYARDLGEETQMAQVSVGRTVTVRGMNKTMRAAVTTFDPDAGTLTVANGLESLAFTNATLVYRLAKRTNWRGDYDGKTWDIVGSAPGCNCA